MSTSGDRRERRQRILPLLSRLKSKSAAPGAAAARSGPLIASYNVHKCVGTDGRFDPERVAAVIAELGADIIALQEAAQRFGRRTALLELKRLERECGLRPVPGAAADAAAGCGWRGNLLLVREGAVRDVRRIKLPGVEPRGALVVDVDLKGGPLRIVAAHLGLLRRSRELQAAAILSAAAPEEGSVLLLGDLNEWRLGPRSSLQGLHPTFGPLTSALPSFPSRFPLFALDRILANPHHLISGLEVHDTRLARLASDHLPVKARLNLNAGLACASSDDGRLAA